ncbi:MAG: alcohol dehydrogenase [Candidatus Omnitrophica bacterium CG1_02_49_16]|nr:MAG: alcohol dehydrogenase [Candidatus Omnitrophica bacterium CG1_02_49_16]
MKNWRETLVKPATPVRKVIETIDKGSMQIALVVDAKNRLIGTVTDGDVRRGILKGISLDEAVERIMRKDPIFAHMNELRENILTLMKKKEIHQLPILDTAGCVVGIQMRDNISKAVIHDNLVIIMAGGLGSRLRPLTENTPKSLLAVGKKPILETIIDNFVEFGFQRFYLAVNYKDEMIRAHFGDGSKWNIEIRYIAEAQKLGTAGALSLLPEKLDKPFFVMNGDLLTKVNFLQLLHFHRENKAAATMCVREYDFQVPYGVVKIRENHTVEKVDEKPVQRFFVNAGIYVLEPKMLRLIPKNKRFDMTQLFEKSMMNKYAATAFPIREYWLDIGRVADLEKANGEFAEVFE